MKSKDIRRDEAKLRQMQYDKLTPKQKLARLDKGDYTATKQRKRMKASTKKGGKS